MYRTTLANAPEERKKSRAEVRCCFALRRAVGEGVVEGSGFPSAMQRRWFSAEALSESSRQSQVQSRQRMMESVLLSLSGVELLMFNAAENTP